jgi:hypothetical protein
MREQIRFYDCRYGLGMADGVYPPQPNTVMLNLFQHDGGTGLNGIGTKQIRDDG